MTSARKPKPIKGFSDYYYYVDVDTDDDDDGIIDDVDIDHGDTY
jgi:hypothetical protein